MGSVRLDIYPDRMYSIERLEKSNRTSERSCVCMIETTVKIDGMMCGMCEAHVSDVIRNQFHIKKVTASHSKGQAVIVSDAPLDEAALRKAIGDTGYTVTDVAMRPYEKKGLLGMFKH